MLVSVLYQLQELVRKSMLREIREVNFRNIYISKIQEEQFKITLKILILKTQSVGDSD